MKSIITIFSILLVGVILLWDVTNNYTYSDNSGAPAGVTGAPSEKTCNQSNCHTGTTVTNIPGIITASGIPAAGYTPNANYFITVTCIQPGVKKWGFEISPQNANGPQGMLIATSGFSTKLVGFGNHYITHTQNGTGGTNSKTWTFNWVAPPPGKGDITFYGAFNYSNNDMSKSGDTIHTSTLTVSENVASAVSDVTERETSFNVYPNPLTDASQVSVYMKTAGTVHFSLLNSNGQVVRDFCNEKNVNGSFIYTMNDISELSSGIYFVRFDTESGTALRRAVIF